MAIGEAVGKIAATLVAMVQTRLELASAEMEEQSQRWLGYLLMSLLALLLGAIAIVMVALFVIIVFWDTHRIAAVLGLAAVFGSAALAIGMRVRSGMKAQPPLLSATIGELRKDLEFLSAERHAHDHQ
jgi:uncharacterized membrane protein YqjE